MSNDQDIQQLSQFEQTLASITNNRHQFQRQLLEVESALKEIVGQEQAYHIIGTVMVKKSAQDIKKDLEEKQQHLRVRVESLEKQEKELRLKAKELQEKVVNKLKE